MRSNQQHHQSDPFTTFDGATWVQLLVQIQLQLLSPPFFPFIRQPLAALSPFLNPDGSMPSGQPSRCPGAFLSDGIKTNALLVSRLAYYELPSCQPLFLAFFHPLGLP